MARLHNLKDWGYGDSNYFEVSRPGYSNPNEFEIELEFIPRGQRFVRPVAKPSPFAALPGILGAYAVVCLPALVILGTWTTSDRKIEPARRLPIGEIAPITWLVGSQR